MKILFLTAGLNPTPGASNSYQEALMEALARRGHDVVCVCTAGTTLRPGVSWTKQLSRPDGYRIFNGGVYPAIYPQGGVGTRQPDRDVRASRRLREAVLEIIRTEKPDIVSIQTFFGLPFSLIPEIKRLGPRIVFTAHDYFPLCPTAHLFTSEGHACTLSRNELVCERCCANALHYPIFRLATQLDRWAGRYEPGKAAWTWLHRLRNVLIRLNRRWNRLRAPALPYRRRHDAAIRMLHELDVVHCISRLQADQIQRIAGRLHNLRILPLSPPTLPAFPPSLREQTGHRPLSLVALNMNGAYKGTGLLERVSRRLAAEHLECELHVYGQPEPCPPIPFVHYHGRYQAADLDTIAAGADFCLIPSIWHETLGFVGMEMMARGVPLIVSSRAGVSEFVESGRTGFVFDVDSDDNLYAVVRRLIAEPDLRVLIQGNLAQRLRVLPEQGGTRFLRFFDAHISEMEALFHALLPR